VVKLINSWAARMNLGSFWCSLICSQISFFTFFCFMVVIKEKLIYKDFVTE